MLLKILVTKLHLLYYRPHQQHLLMLAIYSDYKDFDALDLTYY